MINQNTETLSYQQRFAFLHPPKPSNRLQLKGVVHIRNRDRYYAVVPDLEFGGRIYLQGFSTAIEAAKCYDAWIRENVGEHAWTNFHSNGRRRKCVKMPEVK